jgi:hypothetical protein
MRKFFYFFGIFAAVLIICAIGAIFFLARSGAGLDAASKLYADESVVAITTSWNKDELWKRASPDFKRVTKLDDLSPLFDAAGNALGKLVEYQGAKGQALITKTFGTGTDVRAHYVASAKYERDQATFDIALHLINGAWMIDGFQIQSDAVMRRLTGQQS